MAASKWLLLSLLSTPSLSLLYSGCTNGTQDNQAAVQSQMNADKLKEAQDQIQTLTNENTKLKQDNDALKVSLARLEGHNSGRQASVQPHRSAPPAVNEQAPSDAPAAVTPVEKKTIRQGVTGGDSFK